MWTNNLNLKHYHRYNLNKITKKNKILNEGTFGLKILENGFINPKELKTINFLLKKNLKKQGQFWLNLNPNYIKTKKPIETRMGKGKGNLEGIYSNVSKGRIIIEIKTFSDTFAINILKQVKKKLSLKTKIIKNLL